MQTDRGLVSVGRMFSSICLFVCLLVWLYICSITQKNLAYGITLGYPRNGIVLGLKDQGHRINKCIFHTTNALYRHSLGGVTSHLRIRGWRYMLSISDDILLATAISMGSNFYKCLLVLFF